MTTHRPLQTLTQSCNDVTQTLSRRYCISLAAVMKRILCDTLIYRRIRASERTPFIALRALRSFVHHVFHSVHFDRAYTMHSIAYTSIVRTLYVPLRTLRSFWPNFAFRFRKLFILFQEEKFAVTQPLEGSGWIIKV